LFSYLCAALEEWLVLVWMVDDVITGIPHVVGRLAVNSKPSHFRAQDFMHVWLRKMCPLLLHDFNLNWNVLKILVKLPSIKYFEHPSSGFRVVTCGHTVRETR
jgi:hypothetical protein